jgi:hypothetical protein
LQREVITAALLVEVSGPQNVGELGFVMGMTQ